MPETQSLKYLVMNYFQLPQSVLKNTLTIFPRKRDYYQVPNRTYSLFGPIFNSFKVVADAVNLSLITDRQLKSIKLPKQDYMIAYPTVWSFPGAPYALESVVNTYHSNASHHINNDVTFLPIPPLDFNFIYCDVPKVKTEVPWNFETLTFSFEMDSWCAILLSIVTVKLVLKYIVRKATIIDTVFIVLNSMFPDGLHTPKIFKRVPLFYIWVFMCFFISNHYAATITCLLISPLQENSFSYFSQVAQNNFTVLFDSVVSFRIVNSSVRHQFVGNKNSDILALNQILDLSSSKVRFLANDVHSSAYELPAKCLASERKLVSVQMWHFVIPVVNDVDKLYENIEPHQRPVHCYLGKRLIPSGKMYQIFMEPAWNKGILGTIGLYMMESGISKYWRDEYIALKYARKVQDRNKVISSTKIIYSFEKAVALPLALEGKISSVFFLWVVCLIGGCCTVFLAELCYFKRKESDQKKHAQ